MHLREKMRIFVFLALFAIAGILAQENASADLSNSLIECYNNPLILERDNRLPNNIHTLIAILRKIENLPGLNMDLRTLSTAILHRFRQDGIERNPNVVAQVGVIPFAPLGHSFHRHVAALQLIPGSAVNFPNASLTVTERCTLHYMISSTIERLERGDEGTVCQTISHTAQYREKRDAKYEITTGSIKDDAETLSPQELELIKRKNGDSQSKATTDDPTWMYPPLPPNHPDSARIIAQHAQSACPVESGVIHTDWGAVAAGPLLAGIAAALEPQTTALTDLLSAQAISEGYAMGSDINNRWLATIAGDLAEVALMQGPLQRSTINIGAMGAFNATTQPKWYFLTSTDDLQMTTAEIRGDLDGLILADSVQRWYSSVRSLRLSQILDAYYSSQGVFNASMRACNRRTHFTTVAAASTIADQAYSVALRLSVTKLAGARISAELIRNYTIRASNALTSFIPTSLNDDLTCTYTDMSAGLNRAATHLTILLDTNWPYDTVQPLITAVLEGIEVGMYNSNFTIINGQNGSILINRTNTLLDFYTFNSTEYTNLPRGFDLPRSLDTVRRLQTDRLNEEQIRNTGGSSSEVVLILSYSSTLSDSDRSYCAEQLRLMRLEVPDASFLYVSFGPRDVWSSLAVNPSTDTVSVTTLGNTNPRRTIAPVISRIREFPKRLINSACGASFSSSGNPGSFDDYVEPSGINYYRMHPNYFDYNTATVNVLGAGWGTLNVCHSRSIVQPNSTISGDVSCTTVTTNTHTIEFSCGDASLISDCSPLYLSVQADPSNSMVYQCTDATVCRYPDMRKYTISYGNLVCRSNASTLKFAPFILIAAIIFKFFH